MSISEHNLACLPNIMTKWSVLTKYGDKVESEFVKIGDHEKAQGEDSAEECESSGVN